MSATLFAIPSVGAFKVPVLVVQPELPQLVSILSTLATLHFDVVVADSFKEAKTTLAHSRPALLITDVRLREFNGLHLMLRGRATWPHLPVLITSATEDTVLRQETERLIGTFAVLPMTAMETAAAICRTILRASDERAPIRAPFERRIGERRQAISEVEINRRSADRRKTFSEALTSLAL